MTAEQYRKRWLRLHRKYEKQAYKLLMRAFREMGNSVPYDKLNETLYGFVIDENITEEPLYRAYLELYSKIGLRHGLLMGKDINKQIKDFSPNIFESEYGRNLINWVNENVGFRITLVRNEFVTHIRSIIALGIEEGKTIQQIATEITKMINSRNFYRWQALRIARTETTAAANHGVMVAAQTSRILLDKVWISATDARTRRKPKNKFDHVIMNGVKIDKDEYFNVQGEQIMYPGAPTTKTGLQSSPGNVINCRCTYAHIAKRDRNGKIIRTV